MRGACKEIHDLLVIPGHAGTELVAIGQKNLGFAVVLFGSKLEPLRGHCRILVHAKAVFKASSKHDLGAGIAFVGQRRDEIDCLFILTDIVGCPGFRKDIVNRACLGGKSWAGKHGQAKHKTCCCK